MTPIRLLNLILTLALLGSSLWTGNHALAWEANSPLCNDLLLSSPALIAKTENLYLLVRARAWPPSTKTPVPDNRSISAELRQKIEGLPLSAIADLFETHLNLREILAEKKDLDRAFSNAIVAHPEGFSERADLVRRIIGENRLHSAYILDELMGIPRAEVEHEESTGTAGKLETWREIELGNNSPHNDWLSPYSVLFYGVLREAERAGAGTIADLGCGTGRLGLLAGFLNPHIRFIGLDIHGPRIRAAQAAAERWGFANRIQFIRQDLLDESRAFPPADLYYVYGPTNQVDINNKVLDRLELYGRPLRFSVLSTHKITIELLRSKCWLQETQKETTGLAAANLRVLTIFVCRNTERTPAESHLEELW